MNKEVTVLSFQVTTCYFLSVKGQNDGKQLHFYLLKRTVNEIRTISMHKHMQKRHDSKFSLPVEPMDHVMLRLKLLEALIEMSKFLFDYQGKKINIKKVEMC